jgi:hypothetical protein
MMVLIHGLFSLSYLGAAAAAVAVVLLQTGAMAHQSPSRSCRDHALVEAIAGARQAQGQIKEAFAASRRDIHDLALATEHTVQNVVPRACGGVVAEMRVLETLVR